MSKTKPPADDAPSLALVVVNEKPELPPPDDDDDKFSWIDDTNIVIRAQPETAIYWNGCGQLVVRQNGGGYDDDPFLYFDPRNLPALIEALTAEYESWRRAHV